MGILTMATMATMSTPQSDPATRKASLIQAWQVVALFGFAAWVLTIGAFHEAWFDEGQSWVLARDTANLWTLLAERVRYEGTPGLWHVVLWVAIRLGLAYEHFYWLPAGCAIGGAAVVLLRAPFPPWLRVALLGSYFFGYQFSVIARSYCLDLLLVPLAASFFAERARRPIRYALAVGLIANVNAHGFLAAAMLGVDIAWQMLRARQTPIARRAVALLVVGGLGLFALWSAWQPADNGYLQPEMLPSPISASVAYLCNAFIDRVSVWSSTLQGKVDVFLAAILTIVIQRPVLRLVMAGNNRLVTLAALAAPIAFSAFVYGERWHAGVLFLLWVFALWINWDNIVAPAVRRHVMLAVAGVFLAQGVQTLHSGLLDIATPYASARPAAIALSAWHAAHPQARIDAFSYRSFGVQPWLAGNPYANYHHGAPHPAYVIWSRNEPWPNGTNGTNPAFWQSELASGPDLIVAGRAPTDSDRNALLPTACRMGYGLDQSFPAEMIWRGARIEDETLYFYLRGSQRGCVRQTPAS